MFKALARVFTGRTKDATSPAPADMWGSLAGMNIASPRFAENLSGIASCVSLISGTLAGLPATTWARNGEQREAVPLHPLNRIIRNGSNGLTWSEMIEAWVADALLYGNGLLRIQTDASGRLAGLEWLPWARVSWQLLAGGSVVYKFTDASGVMHSYLPDELVHLRDRLDPATPWLGKSRISRSPGVLNLANIMHTSAQAFSGNLARPGMYLTAPQRIDDDTAKRLREDFDGNFTGKRSGKTAVLGSGLEAKPLTTGDAQAAQLVEQLVWSLQELCRLYNVPASLVGDTTASTFSNSATATRAFAVFCLAPWVDKINEAFNRSVLYSPFELGLDLSELLRGDTETYFKSLALFRNSAIITANEARLATGFDRHEGDDADELTAVQHGGATETQPADNGDPANDKPGAKPGAKKAAPLTH
jgi:HK97 family phage portal protein